jgi:phage replication initiation protein
VVKQKPARMVLSGSAIKWTLEQQQASNPGRVRLDWLRFTSTLDSIVAACPALPLDLEALDCLDQRYRDTARDARAADQAIHPDSSRSVSRAAAIWVCELLACGIEVGPTDDKGMDYYTVRTALMAHGEVVGWVLAGGKSFAQASTVHFNLFGSAMLRIPSSALHRLRSWMHKQAELLKGPTITRVDLALDLWTGHCVTMARDAYLSGGFDVRGKRPSQREHGCWTNGYSRTFEVGSRATGKSCRVYEKGDELFGHEVGDPWVRCEVEFRNSHRVIDFDVLVKPADYFAGAYPYCAQTLEGLAVTAEPETIRTVPEQLDKKAEAAVSRVVRWVKKSAAPALISLLQYGGDILEKIVEDEESRTPRRLSGFSAVELRAAFEKVASVVCPPIAQATYGAVRI